MSCTIRYLDNDALYFRLDISPIIESLEVQPGMILDINTDGKVVCIEILKKKGMTRKDEELCSRLTLNFGDYLV